MTDVYDAEVCKERHDHIKEANGHQDAEIEKLHGRINGIYKTAAVLLATALGALIVFILNHIKWISP